uniref:PH domain-containing protein n=1 Tax=Panagrolaimus sp. ES5 TaxID=591445 RepID=A0AC34GGA7_9BILA
MDIYALKIVFPATRSPRELAKKAFNFIGQCRSPGTVQQYDDSSDSEEDESAFKAVGHAYLTRETDGHTSFLITENEYPLDGSMEMKCEVSKLPIALTEPLIGFWNLCGDSGFHKFWVKMINGILYFYDHPEQTDENFVEPTYLIDMSTICNRQVEREMSVFKDSEHKFTFYMDILSFPRGSDLCEHKRYLISIESEELLQVWLAKINNCLDLIRDRPLS